MNARADGQETGLAEPGFRTKRHRTRVSELVLTCTAVMEKSDRSMARCGKVSISGHGGGGDDLGREL